MPLTPQDRKAELVRKGLSMSDVARQLDLSLNHVSKVIAGERRSPRVEQAVAELIGMPVTKVFPKPLARAA